MPLFGNKKNDKKEKSNEAPTYPKQSAVPPPQIAHYPTATYPQGSFVQQNEQFYFTSAGQQMQVAPPHSTTVAFARTDLPGAFDNFCEGFLDGPDFSNRVPDRNIPPAPGSYYFYSHGNGPAASFAPPYPGSLPGPSTAPAAPRAPASGNLPPPPTYEQVLSQEVKEKL